MRRHIVSGPVCGNPVRGWKLFRLRADGTLGPLFINRSLVVPVGVWMQAEDIPTPGFQRRPGWHAAPSAVAPHLTLKGRVWCRVEMTDWVKIKRPAAQGGFWYLSEKLRVVRVCPRKAGVTYCGIE